MTAHPLNSVDEIVLVVHGVGDPQPGETLSLFARSVAESHNPLTEHQEMLWLEDGPSAERDVRTFASHLRHLEFDGNRATLAEVYWGDISRVSRGMLGIIWGLVQIIFGLRYVAFVASHQSGFAANTLQSIGLISSRILHGPVLAVNFVLAAMMISVIGTEQLWPGSSQAIGWANLLVLECVLVCLSASMVGRSLTRNEMVHRFWFWVTVCAAFLGVLMLINVLTHHPFPLLRYCGVLVTLLGAQWMSLVVVLGALFLCWGFAMLHRQNYRPALHVALILPTIAIGFWGLALPVMWTTGARTLKNSMPNPESFDKLFAEAAPLLGLQFVMAVLLGMLMIYHLARYLRCTQSMSVEQFLAGRRAPRLIVDGSVQLLAAVCAVVGIALMAYIGVHEFIGNRTHDNWLCWLLTEANKYALVVIVPMGGLLVLSMHYLRSGLDIVLDVVNHFHFRATLAADKTDEEAEFDIVDVTFNAGHLYFARRDAIHRRMKRILDYFRAHVHGRPTLTIVSHSQGTMIAIEVINDDELAWINEKFSRVNFITMGSPFHHIYQKYFRHFYPPLDDPFWNNLRHRVSRWLNIFRIDDYVGTDIEFPGTLPQVQSGAWSNHPVQRRGHQFYWRDRQVLTVIRANKICRSLSNQTATTVRKEAA